MRQKGQIEGKFQVSEQTEGAARHKAGLTEGSPGPGSEKMSLILKTLNLTYPRDGGRLQLEAQAWRSEQFGLETQHVDWI